MTPTSMREGFEFSQTMHVSLGCEGRDTEKWTQKHTHTEGGGDKRRGSFNLLVHSLNACCSQSCTKTKRGAQNSVGVSDVGVVDSDHCSNTCCFAR